MGGGHISSFLFQHSSFRAAVVDALARLPSGEGAIERAGGKDSVGGERREEREGREEGKRGAETARSVDHWILKQS